MTNLKDQFYQLTPNEVLTAVESLGFLATGSYFQLNSYENRVFDIFLEDDDIKRIVVNLWCCHGCIQCSERLIVL